MVKNLVGKKLKKKLQPYYENTIAKKLIKFDSQRFLDNAFGLKNNVDTFEQLEGRITKVYHSLEKGFSYQEFRFGFGEGVILELLEMLDIYNDKNYPREEHVYQTALSNLYKYIEIHEENGYDVHELRDRVSKLGETESKNGGVNWISRESVFKDSKSNFKEFSLSRHSVRDYAAEPVQMELVEEAIRLAANTPSACNRQPWKVRIVEDEKLKKTIQMNQNGNRGFGDYIDKFLIITTDVSYYAKNRERNQANIDGGMYAMNLLYSLHYHDIATVSLSASLGIKQELNLRNAFKIEDSENFIMFIGIGNYINEFKVPISARRAPKYQIYK